MQYTAATIFALAAAVAAQSTTVVYNCAPGSASDCTASVSTIAAAAPTASTAVGEPAIVDCAEQYDLCRQPTNGVSANQAQCAADNAQCKATCQTQYDSCRTGPDANMATCASEFATCLGENPFASNGTNTVTSAAAAAPTTAVGEPAIVDCAEQYDLCRQPTNGVSANQAQCAADNAQCKAYCQTQYDSCRTGPDANMATCAGEFATCLGENPFASNGTNTVTSANPYMAMTTQVVTALTTYCPAATQITVNNKVYTVSSATTLTIQDCPCTITKPMTSATWTASTTPSQNGTATTSKPLIYTGAAANVVGAGSGIFAAVAGVAMLI